MIWKNGTIFLSRVCQRLWKGPRQLLRRKSLMAPSAMQALKKMASWMVLPVKLRQQRLPISLRLRKLSNRSCASCFSLKTLTSCLTMKVIFTHSSISLSKRPKFLSYLQHPTQLTCALTYCQCFANLELSLKCSSMHSTGQVTLTWVQWACWLSFSKAQ